MLTDHADLATRLTAALELALPPIAVCLADVPPPGVPAFEGSVPAGCAFWERAASGPFVTATRDHELCAIGVYTHNLAQPSSSQGPELASVLGVLQALDYVREDEVAEIPVLERPVRHVVYAPLRETPLPPDVVLVFADARRGLVVTEAVQRIEPGLPPAMGRPACAVIAQAVNSGRAALSLGCCGARAYLGALDDGTALWALPGSRLGSYVARIEVLAGANRILARFHALRGEDVAAGRRPDYATSLARAQE